MSSRICESCGAPEATLYAYYPAVLCTECVAKRVADRKAAAEAVECHVSGGEATYRFRRGHVCTHYELIGMRPGISDVGELIEITDHAETIRDLFSGESIDGYASLCIVEPGRRRPVDVVSTRATIWSAASTDEWADAWCMRHDIDHMSDAEFERLYEMPKAEAVGVSEAAK